MQNENKNEAEDLAEKVLIWWKDARYWDDGGRNVFSTEPDFVVHAKAILPTSKVIEIMGKAYLF